MHQLKAAGRVDMPDSATREERWLPGQAPLRKYPDLARERRIASPELDRPALIQAWRAADPYCQELARTEAGVAGHLSRTALPAATSPLCRFYLPPDRARAPVPIREAGA